MQDPIKDAFAKVKLDIDILKMELDTIKVTIQELKRTLQTQPTHPLLNPTIPTHNPTHPYALEALKTSNIPISTGNDGVPTNKPTNQQTDQHIKKDRLDNLIRASEILESLDSLKREVRIKFKKLTEQEMTIFSTIYSLEEQGHDVDYALLAQQLSLSEISIRDYIHKIIKKGIPIVKTKQNNKRILLSISDDIRKIASLNTIQQLRKI